MSEVMQEQLFPVEDLEAAERLKMLDFIETELSELDTESRETDQGWLLAMEVMSVAAEGMARFMAQRSGAIDPNADELLSESILGKINTRGSAGPFCVDLDHGVWADIDDPAEAVDLFADLAYELAQAAIYDLRARQRISDQRLAS